MSSCNTVSEDYGNRAERDENLEDGEDHENDNDNDASNEWNNGVNDNLANDSKNKNKVENLEAAVKRLFDICCGQPLSCSDEVEHLLRHYPEAAKACWQEEMTEITGMYPLHVACFKNAPISVVRALLNSWPDSIRERMPDLPLHCACRCGKSLEVIQLLTEVWPDAVRRSRWTNPKDFLLPLHLAIECKAPIDIIRFLVQQWPESVQKDNMYQEVALHSACGHGSSLPVIQFLAEQWPEAMKIRRAYGSHLLHACGSCSFDTVAFLIDACPDSIQVRSIYGASPLDVALTWRCQETKMLLLLIEKWPDAVRISSGFLLHSACKEQANVAVIQALAKAWPDAVRVRDRDGFQPLHHACRVRPCLQTVQFLVELWPQSLKVLSDEGMLPLHFACSNPSASIDVIRYLLTSFPPSVHIEDSKQRLPLHLACSRRWSFLFEAVECLVRAWPESVFVVCDDVDSSARSGHLLALDLACNFQSDCPPELVRLLTNGIPPLHFVFAYTCTENEMNGFRRKTITYLIPLFPEETMRYHQGMLPFHAACRAKAPFSVLELMLQHQRPEGIRMRTTDTNDTSLHCYLSSPNRRTATEETRPRDDPQQQPLADLDLNTVKDLVRRYPLALLIRNRSGWLPLYVAALNDAPVDVLFFLTQQSPESIVV